MRIKIKGKKGSDPFSIIITMVGIIALTLVMIGVITNNVEIKKKLETLETTLS